MTDREEELRAYMPGKTPAEALDDVEREAEIGGTKGQSHVDVLTRTLGREEGLAAATGMRAHKPLVVDAERDADARARALEATSGNEEINEKKLERHGNIGDAARVDEEGRPALGEETA